MKKFFGITLITTLWVLSGCSNTPQAEQAYTFELPPIESIPTFSLPLTVNQAYHAIPHRRTEFDATFSNVLGPEKTYLELMFPLIDQAVVVRVSTLRAYSNGERTDQGIQQYAELIAFVEAIEPPPTLSEYHEHLRLALHSQQAFFQDWRTTGNSFIQSGQSLGGHPDVKTASGHLHAAYNLLQQNFPEEPSFNKNAFFDYHCALDFI